MARKKATQLTITSNDKKVFQALAKTGKITQDLATDYCGVGNKRLTRLEREGYIRSKSAIIDKDSITYFQLTNKGKNWVKNNIATVERLYKPSGDAHDLKLCEKFLQLSPLAQDLARTETDLNYTYTLLADEKERLSPPDLYIPRHEIVIDEQIIEVQATVIEITTENYSEELIQMKNDYVKEKLLLEKEVIVYEKVRQSS